MTTVDEHRTNPRIYFEEHIPRVLEERTQLREKFVGVKAWLLLRSRDQRERWNINIDGSEITVASGRHLNLLAVGTL